MEITLLLKVYFQFLEVSFCESLLKRNIVFLYDWM